MDMRRGAWDVKPESQDVRNTLAEAERAASNGDLAAAEELLKNAARLQEAELGSLHPDLANTLNNLAVIAEKTGRRDDAETLYRRAVAIASAALPPDDPMVASSRQNLEEFCRAHGLPLDRSPAVVEPAPAVEPVPVDEPAPVVGSAPIQSTASPASTAAPPAPRPSRTPSLALAALAIGVLVIVTFFVARPRTLRQSSTPVPAVKPTAPTAAPSRPVPSAVAPVDTRRMPKTDAAPTAISLVTVQLCQTFSASDFKCGRAGDSVAPGSIVLLTRARSPRGDVIVHRWYQGDTLRKSAQLRIGANAAEGYRTYSRQTVDRGDWRVEVRNAAGDLLHEQSFSVR